METRGKNWILMPHLVSEYWIEEESTNFLRIHFVCWPELLLTIELFLSLSACSSFSVENESGCILIFVFPQSCCCHYFIGVMCYARCCHVALQVLLSSTSHIDKSYAYRFLWPWLGSGLLTSTGTVTEQHFPNVRKLIEIHSASVSKVVLPHFANVSKVMESYSAAVKETNSFCLC